MTETNTGRPTLSVVIPNYNGARFLRECLESVLAQEIGGGLEVVISDDGSTDESAEIIAGEFPSVRFIANRNGRGFARNANNGLKAARGKYVAVLNNDTTVAPGWAAAACEALDQDEAAGAVAPKVLFAEDHSLVDSAGQVYRRATGWAGRIGHGKKDGPEFSQRREIFGPTGTCAFFRAQALEKSGRYEEFFESFYEDADLNARINAAGYRCVFEPRSVVYHIGSATYGGARVAFYGSRNVEYMFWLNTPWPRLLLYLLPHKLFVCAHFARRIAGGGAWPFIRGKFSALRNFPRLLRLKRSRNREMKNRGGKSG